MPRGRNVLYDRSTPRPNAQHGLHALAPGPRRDDLDDGPDLRRVEARPSRTADTDRNAAPLECHHFPGAADGAVLVGAVPQCDQHMTISRDEQSDVPVLLVPSALIAANR